FRTEAGTGREGHGIPWSYDRLPAAPQPPVEGGGGAAGVLQRSLPPHLRARPPGRGRPLPRHRHGRGARGAQPGELLHGRAAAGRLRAVPRLAPADGHGPQPARPLLLLLSAGAPRTPRRTERTPVTLSELAATRE